MIRVLVEKGFVVEALHEPLAPDSTTDHEYYDFMPPTGRGAGPPRRSGLPEKQSDQAQTNRAY